MRKNRSTIIQAVLLTVLATMSVGAAERPRHVKWCLAAAGVPADTSAETLVDMLGRGNAASLCAADALQLEGPSVFIDNALLQATRTPFEMLTEAATRALAYRKNFAWADDIIQRLPKIKDHTLRVELAGTLALGERYEGWSVISEAITSAETDKMAAQEALRMAPRFARMKDASGQPVHFAEILDKLIQQSPPSVRADIIQVMVQIGNAERMR